MSEQRESSDDIKEEGEVKTEIKTEEGDSGTVAIKNEDIHTDTKVTNKLDFVLIFIIDLG